MGTHVIRMPDIGEGIAQVELVEWFVKVGDAVSEDQVLADVMTDKATVEIPSSVAGTVVALGGVPGEVMAVGAELIRIEVQGSGNHHQADMSVVAAEPDEADAIADVHPTPSTAPPARAEVKATAAPGKPACEASARPLASPAVRQRARDEGIDLALLRGTGPAGRIRHADLDAFLSGSRTPQAAATGALRTDEERIAVIGLRRKIAQRMQEATRQVAHFSYVEEIDVTALLSLRADLNAQFGDTRGKLTLLPLLIRALVVALRDFPQINAHYDDQQQVVTRYGAVHVGIATQSDNGLMVPVLRHAEAADLWFTAGEINRLAHAARSGKAARNELSGSTITLTSLGALGGIASTPVINRPEVAIVGVNRVVERPMVVNGQIAIRQMMNLSSSFDHRVVDGMDAARFIQAVKRLLEQPAMLFV
ncbi:dihydrolipoamide acetyltransferase family protein [Pseudomonas coleopterorum]|uniref:Dihydrolipoamide acetyltransferase component of pyruvate dehydrogenase complex n=1 Tax=Pseudomonas coleopterorum TaxID=1605838 RepID=A0ABR9C117_9PSED|nr:dihydrolipoamide acetyltransferase family protein [Pseudomonas coleopterorum]MBD8753710.1 2-oxo acid dehydrogenase subunit E2 [Pseudomonas coleopterorum]MBD8770988.1 2-oxo acid dehydrogenase subunit E2 [Pseudomonas coleopterorum]